MKTDAEIQRRDRELISMHASGKTCSELARHFGRSISRVRQIVRRAKLAAARQCEAEKLQLQIRQADDINRRWPTDRLLDALFSGAREINCLKGHYYDHRHGISLKDLMDLMIPSGITADTVYEDAVPALRLRCLGATTYEEIIHRLSELDLGPSFKCEWEVRRKALAEYMSTRW